jgi:predicted secreted protein
MPGNAAMFMLLYLFLMACQSQNSVQPKTMDMKYIIKESDTKVIHRLKMDDQLEIQLNETPTSGYVWAALPDNYLNPLADAYLANGEDHLAGSSKMHKFTFQCKKPGRTDITFSLRRPWDSNDEINQLVFHIEIVQ